MIKQKMKGAFAPALPPGLENLLEDYRRHCEKNGLRDGSIALYLKEDRWFLHNLAQCGCEDAPQINSSGIVTACLKLTSNSYLSTVRTFLRFLADGGYTDRDYSYVVPPYKRPQPIPSVYSEDEIRQMELGVNRRIPVGKRDYAILLLATRLGLRLGDIRKLSFNKLDFQNDVIRLVQQKTDAPLELPMVPELKSALLDYIENGRPDVDSPVVFRLSYPPYSELTQTGIDACFKRVMHKAGIELGGRGCGPRALRSSLASSMVNDDIPYEVVRKTLGHTDPNAISHYARLDIEKLRFYALPVPNAAGAFADFLSGRKPR